MATVTYSANFASNRNAKRDQQYASTLVHYLGVEKALKLCKKNTWTGVRRAIIEQQGAVAS